MRATTHTANQMTRRVHALAAAYAQANPDSPEAQKMLREYEGIVNALGHDPLQ